MLPRKANLPVARLALLLFLFIFSSPKTFSVEPPRPAAATAQIVNGFLVGIQITDPGAGYTAPPAVIISGGGGIGAIAVAEIADGHVTSFVIFSAGIGYTSPPQIQIAPPGGFSLLLRLEATHVQLKLHVVLGRAYQVETSADRQSWTSLGQPFIAEDEDMFIDVPRAQLRQHVRIYEVRSQ